MAAAGAGADSAPQRGTAAARGSDRRRVPLASRRVSCPAGPAGKEEPAGGIAEVTQRFVGAGDVTGSSL